MVDPDWPGSILVRSRGGMLFQLDPPDPEGWRVLRVGLRGPARPGRFRLALLVEGEPLRLQPQNGYKQPYVGVVERFALVEEAPDG